MNRAPRTWLCRGRELRVDKQPLIMGILNVTPDSFSDGGRYVDEATAVEHGLAMIADGADIVDVGGESTRPGAAAVPEDEECRRVIPVVRALVAQTKTPISIDTTKAGVARKALDAGAAIVNDVSALTGDPDMAAAARDSRAGIVLMHMQGAPRTMQDNPVYANVVEDVAAYLAARLAAAERAGIDPGALVVDPGIGFGKTPEHNVELLAGVARFREMRRPVLVGLSRKRFLGILTGREVGERLIGSLAAAAYCLVRGVDILRVHDVRETRDVVRVVHAIATAGL